MNIEGIKTEAIKKTVSVLGGMDMDVTMETGEPDQVKVRQIRVREYPQAMGLVDDTVSFLAFVTNRSVEWINNLSPESYLALDEAAGKVNELFFKAAARTIERRAAQLPKEMIEAVMGDMMKGQSTSQTSSMPSPRFVG